MAEWPKTIWVCPACGDWSSEQFECKGEGTLAFHSKKPALAAEILPADLGRELYEALKELYETTKYLGREPVLEALLARYEREVGDAQS